MNKKPIKRSGKPGKHEKDEIKVLEVFQRRWELLKHIPPYEQEGSKEQISTILFAKYGLSKDERVIHGDDLLLKKQNFLRYIQSDIKILETAFKDLNKNNKHNEKICSSRGMVWWDKERGSPFKVAGFGLNETIAFGMLKKLGSYWLPSEIQNDLEPYYEKAIAGAANLIVSYGQVTQDKAGKQSQKWLSKLEQWPDWISFARPKIKASVQQAVYRSLFLQTRLDIKYQGRSDSIIIHPHLLVQRGVRTYLFATDEDRGGVLHPFLLNRIYSAKFIGGDYKPRSEAELRDRLDKGIAFPKMDLNLYGQEVELKMTVDASTAMILEETPLGRNQTIKKLKVKLNSDDEENAWEVKTTIKIQEELIWWLRSMGPYIKVISPKVLVDRMRADIKKSAELYS